MNHAEALLKEKSCAELRHKINDRSQDWK